MQVDRLLCRGAARVAEHLHLRRGAEVRRRRACRRIAAAVLRRADPARHDDGRRLLLGAPAIGRCVLRRGREARHADGRRQGDDGPQRAGRAAAIRRRSGYDDTKALIAKWHGRGRAHYAITPRFAITSTPEQMAMAEALVREYPDLHMQTHLSENIAEIAFRQELFPEPRTIPTSMSTTTCSGPRRCSGTASTSATARRT